MPSLSCPYCNTAFTVPELTERRVTCPRCGESFPVKASADAADEPTPSLPPPAPMSPAAARSLARPFLLGLALGAVVLGVGLFLVFRTPTAPTEATTAARPNPGATVPPGAVPGLSALPAETNIAFALQPGSLLAYAERTNTDPRQLVARAGLPEPILGTLDRLGLSLSQVECLTGGLVMAADNPIPRVFLVLTLREALPDPEDFRRRLKAASFRAASGATRDRVDVGGLPMEMVQPSPRTYLFATEGRDLEAAGTRKGADHLPAGLRESMGKLSPASLAWLASDNDRWSEKPAVKLLATLQKQPNLPNRLAGVRAVALGLSTEPDLQLTAAVRAPDADAAAKLRERMQATLGDEGRTIQADGPWVTVGGPPTKEAAAGWLQWLPEPTR